MRSNSVLWCHAASNSPDGPPVVLYALNFLGHHRPFYHNNAVPPWNKQRHTTMHPIRHISYCRYSKGKRTDFIFCMLWFPLRVIELCDSPSYKMNFNANGSLTSWSWKWKFNTVSKLKPLNNMTNDALIDARSETAKKDNLPTYQTFLTLNNWNKGIIKRFF